MERPRILLVPTLTEVEWRIRPELEEWADVASFDAPGVGGEPLEAATAQAVVERGLAELDRLDWESCVVVGDEVGAAQAIRLAGARPEAVEALALGHASLSLSSSGNRAPVNAETRGALVQLAETDFRSYVRALTQATQNAYDDELAERYMQRVTPESVTAYMPELMGPAGEEDLEPILRGLDVPMLFVEHRDCLMWTREGYQDAVSAFPDATTASLELKPSVSPEFAVLLREFCTSLEKAPTGIEPV